MKIKTVLHWIWLFLLATLTIYLIITSGKIYIYIIGVIWFSIFIPAVILSIREDLRGRRKNKGGK